MPSPTMSRRHFELIAETIRFAEALDTLAAAFGGYWGEHPQHDVASWQYAIANEDTRQGYWEWVADQIAFDKEDTTPAS